MKCLVLLLLCAAVCSGLKATPNYLSFPSADDFVKIGKSGLDGDRGNSYPWTLTFFKGKLVSCTLRHALTHLPEQLFNSVLMRPDMAKAMLQMWAIHVDNNVSQPALIPTTKAWADQLAAKCYSYDEATDAWTEIFRTGVTGYTAAQAAALGLQNPLNLATVFFPDCAGVRWGLVTKDAEGNDEGLYLMGVGVWYVGLPWARVYRTLDGVTFSDWSAPSKPVYDANGVLLPPKLWDVRGTLQPRDIIEIAGQVCVPSSQLVGALGDARNLRPSIHCRDPHAANSVWSLRTPVPYPNSPNPYPDTSTAFQVSERFNGLIYWGLQNNHGDGISIWTSPDGFDAKGQLEFTQIMSGSFGDLSYSTPLIMETCGKADAKNTKLMFGLSNGAGYYFKNRTAVMGTRGSALYSIAKDNTHTYIVGDTYVDDEDSPSGVGGFLGFPASAMSAGLINPANHYFWVAQNFKNLWFMGTFDSGMAALYAAGVTGGLDPMVQEFIKEYIADLSPEMVQTLEDLLSYAGLNEGNFQVPSWLQPVLGGDLWVSPNGMLAGCTFFHPVTLNGFGNNFNYGIRTMVVGPSATQDECLYVGTANPYSDEAAGGAEVYRWCPQ